MPLEQEQQQALHDTQMFTFCFFIVYTFGRFEVSVV